VSGGALLLRAGFLGLLLLAGSVQAAATHYWPPRQLDVRPQVKTHVMPEYPKDLPSGARGRVVLDVFVSLAGAVDRVQVVRAEPAGRFEQSAVKAFSAARFTPGMRKGKPVPSRLRIEVTFGD
jgi:TonB family protein